MNRHFRVLIAATALLLVAAPALISSRADAAGEILNGFDLSGASIPLREVKSGGPPRDGIPALTDPLRDNAEVGARWLDEDDRVIGVFLGGSAVAYPMAILNWHEIVNDVVGGSPVLVTFCPLCGTGVVFDGRLGGERRLFGVSGLLFRSDVLLYERKTESLFSQLLMRGVSGALKDQLLRPVVVAMTTWGEWLKEHPETEVLSLSTGHLKDYGTDPYAGYHKSGGMMFPVRFRSAGHRAKEWSYLVGAPEQPFVVPEEVAKDWSDGRKLLEDGTVLTYHPEDRRLDARDNAGQALLVVPGYWFAHRAFYPDAPIVE